MAKLSFSGSETYLTYNPCNPCNPCSEKEHFTKNIMVEWSTSPFVSGANISTSSYATSTSIIPTSSFATSTLNFIPKCLDDVDYYTDMLYHVVSKTIDEEINYGRARRDSFSRSIINGTTISVKCSSTPDKATLMDIALIADFGNNATTTFCMELNKNHRRVQNHRYTEEHVRTLCKKVCLYVLDRNALSSSSTYTSHTKNEQPLTDFSEAEEEGME